MRLPRVNETFAGEYVILDELGQGGFAVVYRARWRDEVVALKVLRPGMGGYSLEVVARFNREVQILTQLQSPNILRILGHGRSDDGLLYTASALVPGDDLRSLTERGAVSEQLATHVIREVLKALDEAHSRGLLHRDIKPENIRLTPVPGDLPRVTLLDFGIARHADPERDGRVTETGALVGTPRYMSPEQLRGAKLSSASDLYSLAMVGAEMLLGSEGLQGGSLEEQMERVSGSRFPTPQTEGRLGALVSRALRVRPGDRPQSAAAALRMLDAPEIYLEATAVEHQSVASGRRRAIVAAVALLVGAAAVFALVQLADNDVPDVSPVAVKRPNPLAEPVISEPDVEEVDISSPEPPQPAYTQPPRADHCGDRELIESGVFHVHGPEAQVVGPEPIYYHVPAGYDPERAYPVVLLFHDTRPDSPGLLLERTGFRELADEFGFIVLALGDTKWILGTPWTRSSMKMVRQQFEHAASKLCLDVDSVYVAGSGRGGRAAMYTPCVVAESGGTVRAVATNGWRSDALDPRATIDCETYVPYIHVVGELDPDMPPDGGARCTDQTGRLISTTEHDRIWRDRLGCRGARAAWDVEDRCQTWSCKAPYVSCMFEGDGRSWGAVAGCTPGGPETEDLADVLWRFFSSVD